MMRDSKLPVELTSWCSPFRTCKASEEILLENLSMLRPSGWKLKNDYKRDAKIQNYNHTITNRYKASRGTKQSRPKQMQTDYKKRHKPTMQRLKDEKQLCRDSKQIKTMQDNLKKHKMTKAIQRCKMTAKRQRNSKEKRCKTTHRICKRLQMNTKMQNDNREMQTKHKQTQNYREIQKW